MPQQEEDPVALVESAPKRMFEFLAEMYKALRDKAERDKQMKMAAEQQQAGLDQQKDLQKQNQQFMSEQNQKLMDAFKESKIPATDDNIKLAKDELKRLGEIADEEVAAEERIGEIDERVAEIDQETQELFNPDPNKPPVDPSKRLDELQKLNTEKGNLIKEKLSLQGKLEKLETERQGIMKGEGLKELEGIESPGEELPGQQQDVGQGVQPERPGWQQPGVSEGVERGGPQLGKERMKTAGKTGPIGPSQETLSDISSVPLETAPLEPVGKQGVQQSVPLESPGKKIKPSGGLGKPPGELSGPEGPRLTRSQSVGDLSMSQDRPSHFVGGVDTSRSRSNSVGATFYKDAQKTGKFNSLPSPGLKQGMSTGVK